MVGYKNLKRVRDESTKIWKRKQPRINVADFIERVDGVYAIFFTLGA
jgi:hypothetical protein